LSTSLPPAGTNAEDLADSPPGYTGLYFSSYGDAIQAIQTLTFGDNTRVPEHYDPGQNTMILKTADGVGEAMASDLIDSAGSSKDFFGMVNYLAKPANHQGTHPNPVEVFTQFSPISLNSLSEMSRPCTLNQIFSMIGRDLEVEQFLNQSGIDFPASSAERGWWGASYNSGSTAFPLSSIPSSPLFSLAQFSHASLGVMASEPSRAVGNSWANLFLSPVSTYGRLTNSISAPSSTAADTGWLLNDALFDRYYLSGLAPDFNITSTGYSQTAPMADTLDSFFSADYTTAQANPVLRPYLPEGTSAAQAVTALAATDGYLKTGAYSLIDGAFNVNSTSVAAWQALLSANRDLAVTYANGVSDGGSNGTPFPNSTSPAATGGGAASGWAGLTRITNAQIITLAQKIVDEVKLRGPFMSLSDFINHRVGLPKNNATHYRGALQTAIDAAGINANVHNTAGGVTPDYANMSAYMPDVDPDHINRKSTTGIATDITQADLLLSLAPRLTARSDTFRIRSYGEIRSPLGGGIVSKVVGEAVVQRLPEYVDAVSNQPWDEATGNPLIGNASGLSAINQTFGRRFKVVSFRWLTAEEI